LIWWCKETLEEICFNNVGFNAEDLKDLFLEKNLIISDIKNLKELIILNNPVNKLDENLVT
jgi:hypothetical protein